MSALSRRLDAIAQAIQPITSTNIRELTDAQLERIAGLGPNPTTAELEAVIRNKEKPCGNA